MSKTSSHFDDFDDHTELKHLVVSSYLRAWSAVRISPSAHPYGWFIDAFAGQGKDASGKLGSPLIACEISREVESRFPTSGSQRRLTTFAIERLKKNYDALIHSTTHCRDEKYIVPLLGSLEEHIGSILSTGTSTDPRLFFLDPFGVKGLRADVVREILAKPGSEVLLLFHDIGANRLHGAAVKPPRNVDRGEELSLFDTDIAPQPPKETVVDATGPASEAILRIAFGDSAYDKAAQTIRSNSPHERSSLWRRAYTEVLRDLGGKYVVHFSVRDRAERHKYYLMHASTHRRAIHKMKEAIQTAMLRHNAGASQETMFYQTTVDINTVVGDVQARFAGREAAWSGEYADQCIRAFLIEETDVLLADLPAILAEMQSRGWLIRSKPRLYKIP